MNSTVQDNKVKYNSLATLNNGVNYLRNTHFNYKHFTFTKEILTGEIKECDELKTTLPCNMVLEHWYGTITRDDITDMDNVSYYIIDNSGPLSDKAMIVPINYQSCVTQFDFTCLCHNLDHVNCIYYWMAVCDKNQQYIQSHACTLKLNIDIYCL